MTTLQEARQATAKLLGGYEGRGAVAASGARRATAGSTTAALVEARWPILRTRSESDAYEGATLLRTDPLLDDDDRVRQIGPAGYVAQEGRLVPDTDWSTAPAAGEEYELHTHGWDPEQELTRFINDALRAITVVVDVTFTPETDEKGAYVPAFDDAGLALAWLQTPGQIASVRQTAAVGPLYVINGGDEWWWSGLRGEAWVDGGRLYLGVGSAAAFWVRAYKPAYWHCQSDPGAAYGQAAGLRPGHDGDAALPAAEWIASGAAALAWEQHPDTIEAGEARLRATKIAEAKQTFYGYQRDYYAQADPDTTYTRRERLS